MPTCEVVRELLWPLDRPRPLVEGEEGARAHLARCAACQAFFRRDRAIGEALRRRGPAVPTPPDVRERALDALARERPAVGAVGQSRHRRLRPSRSAGWAAAAAVLASVAVGIFGPRAGGREALFAEDFLSRAVEADVVERPDRAAISAFFMRELGVQVAPVTLDEAELNRAMICLIKGKRAAMVEYEFAGRIVAHYRVPAGQTVGATPTEVRTASEAGVQVVRWSDDRFEHALVSELPAVELENLARRRFISSQG